MTTETLMTDGDNTQQAEGTQDDAQARGQQEAPAQSAEGQSDQGQQSAGDNAEQDTAAKPGAPEAYDFKAPEGSNVDPGVLGAYAEVAKELNLSQDDAQKVVDKVAPAIAAHQAEQLAQVRQQWHDATTADKEIGGAALTENIAVAKRAMDAFGTPELKSLLETSGLGNHPEIIRAFYRAGKAISPDNVVTGKAPPSAAKRPEQVLYDSTN